MLDREGYRPNVGIVLVNARNEVFWGKRIREHSWQFPQGGINKGETPEQAMYRELQEETGLLPDHVEILGRTRDWLRYDVPKHWIRREWRNTYRGQKQIWFLLRLVGRDTDVSLRASAHPEFDAWRWNEYWVPLESVIEFKRLVYQQALTELAHHLSLHAADKGYTGRERGARAMIDSCILALDRALRTLFTPATTTRAVPGADQPEAELDAAQRAHAAALMRVNHCGEICAQALYQGQAMVSREPAVTRALEQAAREETEHLAWTERRIAELGGKKSLLNPLWYGGSLALGLLAGRLGSAWNLGFLAETERQVESHLESYMARLPGNDRRSWLILEQMRQDEAGHAATARRLGGRELPETAKQAMRFASRLMTASTYRV